MILLGELSSHLRITFVNIGSMNIPLAERLRPKFLDEYLGQKHLMAPNAGFRRAIHSGRIPSLIFWGPPGVGKTTLANLIAKHMNRPFFSLSAVHSGVKEVREVLQKAEENTIFNAGKSPILFIDEIHRFSKSQQDSLLGAVEKGSITLIGATTENPSFEVISALLSRCQVYVLEPLNCEDLEYLLKKAITEDELIASRNVELRETEALLRLSGGDARRLLTIFELVVGSIQSDPVIITNDIVLSAAQQKTVLYDKSGDQHYDIVSAFIKSIRGSDPNAAVYWLARMVEGGEDPKFIARRMLILASEDIGLANPTALVIANSTFQAVQAIGWPESRIILSHCAIYLAHSPKGNAAYRAIEKAQKVVRETGDLSVPIHLRNAPTSLMKSLGYGANYDYPHDFQGNFVEQEYLPEEIKGTQFFEAGDSVKEREIVEAFKIRFKGKYKP
jgi:putative ATPase